MLVTSSISVIFNLRVVFILVNTKDLLIKLRFTDVEILSEGGSIFEEMLFLGKH